MHSTSDNQGWCYLSDEILGNKDFLLRYMKSGKYIPDLFCFDISEPLRHDRDIAAAAFSQKGEIKTVKTVSRAEVAAIVAYMLGLDDEHLEEYYSHHYAQLLQSLRSDKNATIIRYLCSIRTILMNHFLQVDNEMRYNLSNLDCMKYFNREEISQLDKWGVHVMVRAVKLRV